MPSARGVANSSCLVLLRVELRLSPGQDRKSLWVPSGWEHEARASLLPAEPWTNRICVNKTMLNQTHHDQTASLSEQELNLCRILTSFSTAILNFNLPAQSFILFSGLSFICVLCCLATARWDFDELCGKEG